MMNRKIQKKPLPEPGKYDIIPPDMNYLYFQNADQYPFEAHKKEYSPVNAWWLCEAAFLAYCHPGFTRMAWKLAGFDHFSFFQGKGTECMISWNDDSVIVAFRGTELKSSSVLHEVLTDLNTQPVPFNDTSRVHKGFLAALDEVWEGEDGLSAFLHKRLEEKPDRPLWICGHSLGGALASLCFARFPGASGLYVYGAPRVGDEAFVTLFKGRPVWRIEHARDPVPLVPPDLPAVNFNYKDLGSLVYISKDGVLQNERPVVSLDNHKNRILEVKGLQDERKKEIGRAIVSAPLKKESSKEVLEKINRHFKETRKEWRTQLEVLHNEFGLKVDDHQPLYYAIQLWNALL